MTGASLRWAIGCVVAGYRRKDGRDAYRCKHGMRVQALACLIALLALREFFAPLLIFAYRMKYLGLAHFLGLQDGGR